MKENAIARRFQALQDMLKFGFLADVGREPSEIGKIDASILKVAMLVAALDGNVMPEELAAFDRLARECRGGSEASARKLFREGLRAAGYVELAARTVTEDELLEAFQEEAAKILPKDFAFWPAVDLRRAFATWTAMAMSDGDYSGVERRAISAFAGEVTGRRDEKWSRLRDLSAAHMIAYRGGEADDKAPGMVLTRAFFAKVEEELSRLGADDDVLARLRDLILKG